MFYLSWSSCQAYQGKAGSAGPHRHSCGPSLQNSRAAKWSEEEIDEKGTGCVHQSLSTQAFLLTAQVLTCCVCTMVFGSVAARFISHVAVRVSNVPLAKASVPLKRREEAQQLVKRSKITLMLHLCAVGWCRWQKLFRYVPQRICQHTVPLYIAAPRCVWLLDPG